MTKNISPEDLAYAIAAEICARYKREINDLLTAEMLNADMDALTRLTRIKRRLHAAWLHATA